MDYSKLIAPLSDIALETADLILQYYHQGNFKTYEKPDDTPVTTVDYAASELLVKRLSKLTPDFPVLSEEAIQPWQVRRNWQRYWLVDPLDGTQEFVAGSGDFAVSIALIENGQPVLGMIAWPTEKRLYHAVQGQGAFRDDGAGSQPIQVRKLANPAEDSIVVALSRRQPKEKILDRYFAKQPIEVIHTGSCALKSALVAEGSADVFLRIGPTGEWDTGAAEVLIAEAGGKLVNTHFQPLSYNQSSDTGNPDFLVLGDPAIDWPQVFPAPVTSGKP
ncbi:3'(2'),5'-bisphosphate nucleotidase [Aliidiomarina iranensis]|uniref:3'(2'),5'-bisphosphate nucleotidase CysQ n=1 Tax=Aliidiomarina iranensis TaxID=1434071 RepID=A0A432W2F8_9GAMM|nr:3'(2'),5'-bisphosphate nucleotidase CysQ [Aliidiomarina iranensis]RUO23410.1 3'(2'),5'-bisphosphate nucleotidase [Aliidiomarina iranensis]